MSAARGDDFERMDNKVTGTNRSQKEKRNESSNWFGSAAAADALRKWYGGRGEESGEVRGPWVLQYPREIFENVDANLCNLVHFEDIRSSKVGRKIDAFPSHSPTFKSGTEITVPAV